jgi:hypothetical protein
MMKFLALMTLCTCSLLLAKEATRLSNGKPSAAYWQQRVDYAIDAELLPDTKKLTGKGTITYFNNSPDTLHSLVWHVYQNVFRKESSEKNITARSRYAGMTKGMEIEKLSIGGTVVTPTVDATIMETILPQPLLPHTKVTIEVAWNYDVPRDASLRTGSTGDDFGMCQWYPQLAVYDDERGWNRTQYLGSVEFYLEYGSWTAKLTLPSNYIVAATGTLQNATEVLSADQLHRLNSLSPDSVSKIILPSETGEGAVAVTGKTKTWVYSAEDVRDFAWAASPDFVWDATKTKAGVNIYAFYKAKDARASLPVIMNDASNWDEGARMAKHAIEFYSARYGAYAYPQATVVSGPVDGMEYPMMIFASEGDPLTNELELVIAHELGHEWYPMMIGSNESNYPFMDEGFNTYITSYAVEDYSGSNGLLHKDFVQKYSWMRLPDNNERQFEQRLYLREARSGKGSAIMSHPYSIPPSDAGVAAYMKPGSVQVMLEDVLGRETFEAAMLEYYHRWKFKHPFPQEYFNTIEDVAGRDLDWFWNEWFEQTWKLDIAITDVTSDEHNGIWKATISLENEEQVKMPASLQLSLADGTSRTVRFPETIWDRSNRAQFVVDSLPAKVTHAVVDPNMMLADVNRLNNSWCMPRVEFDYGFNFLNKLLFPLDAYRINFAPSLGFNLRDGVELGTSINGSYMSTEYNTTVAARYGTRSGIPDYDASYSTPLRIVSPALTTTIKAFRLDGRSGGGLTMQALFEGYTDLVDYFRQSILLSASMNTITVDDRRYLGDQNEWANGNLLYGTIGMTYRRAHANGGISFNLSNEFGMPTSAFLYSKLTAELRTSNSIGDGFVFRTRTMFGISDGNVPAQSAYSLTQATPLERFDSWFFRTPIVGQSFRSHWTRPGGGNLFLTQDTTASRLIAINASLSQSSFVTFADYGAVYDTTISKFSRPYFDAGLGWEFRLGGINRFGVAIDSFAVSVLFPFYVKDPSRPNDKELAYRWKIIFGARL